jgi:GNAT superfamily N-acetyltransferase
MTTREAHTGDFPAVFPLLRQLRLQRQRLDPGLFQLHPDAERRFLRWVGAVGEDSRSTLLVAEEQGRLVGFMYAVVERDLPIYLCEEFAVVREWWVEPSFRKAGVREALLELAIAELAAGGVCQLRVRTGASDRDDRAILRRCGFRAGTREMVKDWRAANGNADDEG